MYLLLRLSLYFTYLNKSTVQNEGTVEICFAISKSGLFTCMLRRITDLGYYISRTVSSSSLNSSVMLPTVLSEHHHTSWKCCSSPKNSKDLVNYQKYKCGKKERDVVQKLYHELSKLPDITAKRLNSLSKLHLDSFWVLTSTVYSKKCPLKVITDSVALKRVQKQEDNKQMKTHPGQININDNSINICTWIMNKLHKGNHPSSFFMLLK
jgi:hypothetical protein